MRWEDGVVNSPSTTPVVIRISPMAHFAVGFLALGMLALYCTRVMLISGIAGDEK